MHSKLDRILKHELDRVADLVHFHPDPGYKNFKNRIRILGLTKNQFNSNIYFYVGVFTWYNRKICLKIWKGLFIPNLHSQSRIRIQCRVQWKLSWSRGKGPDPIGSATLHKYYSGERRRSSRRLVVEVVQRDESGVSQTLIEAAVDKLIRKEKFIDITFPLTGEPSLPQHFARIRF